MRPLFQRPLPRHRLALLVGAFSAIFALTTHGQVVNLNLGGIKSHDGWEDLLGAFYPGYGGFPGASSWPEPIDSNTTGSGDARLQRVNGGGGGGPFPAGESVYFGSFQQNPNELGGTLRIQDTTPVAGVKTVVFQIQIGEAVGYDFHSPSGAPVLRVNGQPANLASRTPERLDRYQNGVYFSPATQKNEPVYVNTWGFQWDVSNLGSINSIQIEFSAVTHAQIYAMRLDQSSQAYSTSVFNGGGTTETRVIALSGDLTFGSAVVGQSATRTLTISNNGNSALAVSGISFPSTVYSGNWSGTIPAGGSQPVTITFQPAAAASYSGNITVNGNPTSGTSTIAVSGSGTPPAMRQSSSGTPQYNGSVTSVTHRFNSTPSTSLQIQYTENLADPSSWVMHPHAVNSGHGAFDVTFSRTGDHRAAWSRGMYFRLLYQTQP